MSHTPEPWDLHTILGSGARCSVKSGLARIASVSVGNIDWEANARLIQASPRMLSALKYAEASIAVLCEATGRNEEAAQLLLPIRAAIAQAETE